MTRLKDIRFVKPALIKRGKRTSREVVIRKEKVLFLMGAIRSVSDGAQIVGVHDGKVARDVVVPNHVWEAGAGWVRRPNDPHPRV